MSNMLLGIVPILIGGGVLLAGCGSSDPSAVSASTTESHASALAHGSEAYVHRSELLVPKDAPVFSLIDQDGKPVKSEDLDGKVALVGFVFTNCPDICRAITATYLDMQTKFAKEVDADELELILITTDPARDTPEQAKKYTEGFGGKWSFLTGSEEDLDEVWSSYHVSVENRVGAAKSDHTWMVVLIDRSSQIRIRYMGQDVPKDVLTTDVRNMLEEKL